MRDAEHELRPYVKENKIISLYKELTKYYTYSGELRREIKLNQDKKDDLAKKLEDIIQEKDWSGLIKTGEEFINEHLEKADINKKGSKVSLRLLEYKYENIIKGILARKPVYDKELINSDISKQKYFDLSQNGLGENNLVYASAVLGDLENRRKEKIEHYYALLIEEPEAHLHPQKQNTFFNYLNSLQNLGIQIFITSHSPTITAKSNLDNIIVLQKQNSKIFSLALKDTELTLENKEYLRRFLDVTKSQLFFSNGAILVEGISETLLLPVFAEIMGGKYNLNKNGIEVINVNGVSFEPFAKLYNSKDKNKRLPSYCAILTDGDEHRYDNNKSPRVKKLELLEYGNLTIKTAYYTFEYELICASERNADIIREVYMELHTKTDLLIGENLVERAIQFVEKLDQNEDKAIFAQLLSFKLATIKDFREDFVVPEYIQDAITWVID